MDDHLDSAVDPTIPTDAGAGERARAPELREEATSMQQQWREEFPYHWRADDLITRRDTLRFLVAGSGALFVMNVVLALAGGPGSTTRVQEVAIARVSELAENEFRVFDYPDAYGQGILVNLPGGRLVAYSDVCTHLSCAVLYRAADNQLYCPCHEGHFDVNTGEVLAGPPTRPLPVIALAVRNGVIYAVREVER
jgi:Rieske Fe-S protein